MLPEELNRERSTDSTFLSAKIPAAQHHNRFVYVKSRSGKPQVEKCLAGISDVAKKRHFNLTLMTDVPVLMILTINQITGAFHIKYSFPLPFETLQ
ncbi:hypothetical protein Pan161_36630 [Gimesia algae]|uniref:Uncharacterized protein n=1 Tax=Gimesia algae TaxID=2527971 RepID=A0A517VG67_9PLAN|nr:hypothetical protein Pan161_36630 [Gimesia algae]